MQRCAAHLLYAPFAMRLFESLLELASLLAENTIFSLRDLHLHVCIGWGGDGVGVG